MMFPSGDQFRGDGLTHDDITNHCPACEANAKRIERDVKPFPTVIEQIIAEEKRKDARITFLEEALGEARELACFELVGTSIGWSYRNLIDGAKASNLAAYLKEKQNDPRTGFER